MMLRDMIGKTMVRVEQVATDRLEFDAEDGSRYALFHCQDCCESVAIEDINGDLADLVGVPLLMADEATSGERPADLPSLDYEPESQTWTFYKFGTIKGYVDVRWFGQSNGWYSEGVSFASADGSEGV